MERDNIVLGDVYENIKQRFYLMGIKILSGNLHNDKSKCMFLRYASM